MGFLDAFRKDPTIELFSVIENYNYDINLIKKLIDKRADLNARMGGDNNTALLLALRKKHTEIAKLIIENGADVNVKNK